MGSIIGTLLVDVEVEGEVMASLGSVGSGWEGGVGWAGGVGTGGLGGAWVSGGISGAVDPRPNRPNRCPPSLIAGVLRRCVVLSPAN
jgi:hypothetical protein